MGLAYVGINAKFGSCANPFERDANLKKGKYKCN